MSENAEDIQSASELLQIEEGHEECLICGRPVPDFIPVMCCDGRECGCMGLPTNPCVCSEECSRAVFDHIGFPFDQRRELAGIAKFDTAHPDDWQSWPICEHCDGSAWAPEETPTVCPHCIDGRRRPTISDALREKFTPGGEG